MTKVGPRGGVKRLDGENEIELFGKGFGPEKIISVSMPEDGKHLLITVLYGSAASKTEVYVLNVADNKTAPIVNDVAARFNGRIADDTLFLQN